MRLHGDHMRHIRKLYGEKQPQFARRLGFEGTDDALARKVRRYEKGETQIDGPLGVLLKVLEGTAPKADTHRR